MFDNARAIGNVDSNKVTEASGLAASRKHPNILYTHNDHGGGNRIYAIDATTAHVRANFEINHADSNDWEDVAVGPCHGSKTCLYIGDTGNSGQGAKNIIYRVLEPDSIHSGSLSIDAKIHFTWDAEDCETLMVDPKGEIYIISKVVGGKGLIAHIPSSGFDSGKTVHVSSSAYLSISTSHPDPVGGDISPSGDEILIKTRDSVLYWDMNGSNDYVSVLQTQPIKLPYINEHQGEAVAWQPDGRGYYTLGEGLHSPLYHYRLT
ncbi:hypothetical protein CHS0354_034488 [Potamilus streckersoni]|uniref:Uncharacterized protein n=1 Tax=Potamilus streckersoni TaxID=2493646 RepID=A0AAE0W5H0_9BIVA|nr:hypothetical protein CHS0354_034488 [Potamilus streckersoni]